jgi:hypothetical protein
VAEWKLAWFSNLTTVRFRLGHDKPITAYLENLRVFNRLDNLEGQLISDKLQSSSTATAVWLGGPSPASSSLDDIEDILLTSPRFQKYKISMLCLKAEIIHVTPGPLGRKQPKIKELHVLCAKSEKSCVRKLLKLVHPSRPTTDYPQGIQLRAIEDTADPDFPVPKRARAIADRMRTKQNHFLKSLVVTHYENFKNIHSTISHPKDLILSQLLYNWRSSEDSSTLLFIMIEQDYEEGPTKFSYLASLQDEVASILPVLPLVLMGRLGPAALAWLLPSHTLGMDGNQYDPTTDRVVPIDAGSILADIDRHWEQSDEGFTGHADLAAAVTESYNGFAINIGDLFVNEPTCSRILGDNTASVATLGIPPTSNEPESDANDDSDIAIHDPNSMDLDSTPTDDANTTIGSSLTESTQHLTLDDSL